jgi:hypothetical protein
LRGGNGLASGWLIKDQRGPGRELVPESHTRRFQVMGARHARDSHVNLTGPFAGTEEYPRAAARTETPFRLGAGWIPAKKVRPSINAELIGFDANPAHG